MSRVMGVLHFFLELLIGAGFLVAGLVAITLVVHLVLFVSRRLAARTEARIRRAQPPSWWVTLLVDVDEEARLFRPSLQLRGSPVLWWAVIRLELVDERGVIRISCESRLPPWAIGTELALPAFPPPEGAEVEEVLGWHWDVVIEAEGKEKARWREHPAPAGPVNAEAELELPGVAAFPEA